VASYAVLLVSKTSPKTSYKLMIFSLGPKQSSYEPHVLDQSEEGGGTANS
jgi:hypothetical protein